MQTQQHEELLVTAASSFSNCLKTLHSTPVPLLNHSLTIQLSPPLDPPSLLHSLLLSRPLLFPPHNYFNQGLPTFPPNPNFHPQQGVLDHLSKLGLIHTNQQQQDPHNNNNNNKQQLLFGSLPKNANLDYDLATIEQHLFQETELFNPNLTSLTFGNYTSSSSSHRPIPPPGFAKEHPLLNGNHSHSGASSHLHSLSATHVHDLNQNNNGLPNSPPLHQHLHNLLLQDATDEDNTDNVNTAPKSRDKDYRSDKRGQWLLNQRMRNQRSHIQCRGDINRLNAHFLEIFQSLIPPEEEKEKQKQLMALLNKHVTNEWPRARLFLYGSCANSFGFRKSDIDVCLAMGDADVDKSEILLKLADILKSDNLENVQALTRARVPIVKLMDPVTGISCDICVNNLLAVINTKLLRDYSKIDVRLRQLAFIVKHWAKSRGVRFDVHSFLAAANAFHSSMPTGNG
ncbi:hypothetical protein M8C21_032163, partial [Ambrosia artemisiifolia]